MADDFQPRFVDLVRNFTTVQGTGPVTPGATVNGHTGFAQATAEGDQFYYCIQGVDKPAEREVGRGTMQADGTIRREPISGSLTHFSSGTKTIALVTAAEWFNKVGQGGGGPMEAASRAALASRQPRTAAFLVEPGREGLFLFDGSDLSAFVAADTLQGMYVAPASDTTGASGAWVRHGDVLTPFMFGGRTNSGTGKRSLGTYRESQTPGGTDGILVDSRAACQAMLDMMALHENRQLVGDFSGGIWGISDRGDGIGLYIDQDYAQRRTFIGGQFRGIGAGTKLIHVQQGSYSRFAGEWHVRSGADLGTSYGYAARQWETGIWIRNSAMARWETVKVSGFQRWGVETDADQDTATNNNIGLRFERVYVNNCGSALDRNGYDFSIGFTASARTGSSGSSTQRTELTLAEGHEILRAGDIIRDAAGDYHVILSKSGNVIAVYPWVLSTAATGTIHSAHGGAMKVTGTDVAGAGADSLTSVTCGTALDISNSLHGTSWGDVIQEGGGIGTVIGTHLGANAGQTIGHMHSESVELDLLAIFNNNVDLVIGACSAWAGQDYSDAFKLTRVLTANNGSSLSHNALPRVAIYLNGTWLQSGVALGATGNTAKSRAYAPTLSNNPTTNRIRKVQQSAVATNVTLKYYESLDRCLRDCFIAELEVVGFAGGAPAQAVTVTLDAADVASGIQFLNGTTMTTYVVAAGAATGPLRLAFWLDTNGSTLRWIVVPISGVSASLGYSGSGTGGVVTQTGGKAAGVTLHKVCGQIIMDAAELAAGASASFVLANSKIAASDTMILNIGSGAATDSYETIVSQVSAGSCRIQLRNISAESLAEAVILNFAIIKAVAA